MAILVLDVGGTNVKISIGGRLPLVRIPSGPKLTPVRMVAEVKRVIAGRIFDAVSIGYPGPVVDGQPTGEPKNLAGGWVRFDYKKAFGAPVRIINDAAMQALGSYRGGRMLFLGLGTGLGSALVVDGVAFPLELAHLPYRNGRTFEDYVGLRAYKRMGAGKWQKHVRRVIEMLKNALQVDYVMLGGGQARKLEKIPACARLGDNTLAIQGGRRLWADPKRGYAKRPALVAVHSRKSPRSRRAVALRRGG
jgi:polyphosphate glucokinase